jgi:hypothetical protein
MAKKNTSVPTVAYEGIAIVPTATETEYSIGQCESGAYSQAPGSRTSGYRDLEEIISRLAFGGYVIDKRNLPWESVVHVISGPMDSCTLPPMTISIIWEYNRTFRTYEEFLSYAAELKAAGRNLSMAYLSLDLYAEYWRRLGAKVGRKVQGEIVWKPAYSRVAL